MSAGQAPSWAAAHAEVELGWPCSDKAVTHGQLSYPLSCTRTGQRLLLDELLSSSPVMQ
jgi:hypothetical protein